MHLDGRGPFLIFCWSAGDAELNDKIGNNAEEGSLIVEFVLDKAVEVANAERCPRAGNLENDRGASRSAAHDIGLKLDLKSSRCDCIVHLTIHDGEADANKRSEHGC